MSLIRSRFAGYASRIFFAVTAMFLSLGAVSCGSHAEDIPYSTLKQHIVRGDVREVRLSATEILATPTEQAQGAGAPATWSATPVLSDNLVPLLESKGITYG